MIHAVIALAVQAILTLAGLDVWAAGAIPAAFYAGREVAQAEYRSIERHYGRRGLMPWWAGFMPDAWTRKAVIDVLLPAAACAAVSILFQ